MSKYDDQWKLNDKKHIINGIIDIVLVMVVFPLIVWGAFVLLNGVFAPN